MGHWVYAFSGCPDTGDFEQITDDQEPGDVVLRERAGGLGIMDGFVRENVDDLMRVARFRWVAGGDPSMVAPAVLQASGLPPLTRRGARPVRAGNEPDAGDSPEGLPGPAFEAAECRSGGESESHRFGNEDGSHAACGMPSSA